MDEGSIKSSAGKTRSRCPLQEQLLQRRNSRENDGKGKENLAVCSPSREAYQKQLGETFSMNRTRILTFKNKRPTPVEAIPNEFSAIQQGKPTKPHQYIPQTSERTLDAPVLVDDYYSNLLDWGSSNVLAIPLGNTVYLWDATDGATSELVTIDDQNGPVTSVKGSQWMTHCLWLEQF